MELFEEFFHRLSWEWLLGAAVIIIVFDRTGFIQKLFHNHVEERISEREQLSEDQAALLDHYRTQAEQEHAWRLADAKSYQDEIKSLRAENIARMHTITALTEANAILLQRLNISR